MIAATLGGMRGRLSVVLLALAFAGCHSAKPASPAWPAPSTTAEDGGESIEPHSTAVAASIERSDSDDEDDASVDVPAEIPAKAATPEPDKPPTISPPTQPTSDDVIISEEIIIEIDD